LSDYKLEFERHASRALAPGERLLEAVRAMPVGPFGGSLGIFSGAVVGAVVHSVAVSRSVKKAAISRFPAAGRMVIGLTDHRVLVWKRGGAMGKTVTELVGEIPLWRITSVSVDRIPGRCKLTFVLRDAHAVTVETDRRDASERFVEAFNRCAEGAAVVGSADSVQSSEQLGGPILPFAPAQPFEAAAPAATAVAEHGERGCPTCGTRNPASSAFCWRCLTPFGPQPQPSPQPVPPKPSPRTGSRPSGLSNIATIRVAALIGLPVMVIVAVTLLFFRGSDRPSHSQISMPATIAGTPKIVASTAAQQAERVMELARGHGLTGTAGMYGLREAVSFGVVLYDNDAGLGDSPQTLMAPLVTGVAGSATGFVIDLSTMTTDSSAGATYRCAQVTGPAAGASCVWQDSSRTGVVLALNQGVLQARVLTETVRAAIESIAQPPDPSAPSVLPA
jgi:hypothetical protein